MSLQENLKSMTGNIIYDGLRKGYRGLQIIIYDDPILTVDYSYLRRLDRLKAVIN
jgi:hypothetical protein